MNADVNQVSERVIGCACAVSSALGSGFLESVYESALALEMAAHGLNVARQKRLPVHYREKVVGEFIADFLVEQRLIVEIKAVRSIVPEHQAQLLNYLNASGLNVGLLINFGTPRVQIKRMVNRHTES
jgi:GxxExxY protein